MNDNWHAVYLSNSAEPLASVTLDGNQLQRDQFNFWVHPGKLSGGPLSLVLTSVSGKQVTTTIDSVMTPKDLGIQF